MTYALTVFNTPLAHVHRHRRESSSSASNLGSKSFYEAADFTMMRNPIEKFSRLIIASRIPSSIGVRSVFGMSNLFSVSRPREMWGPGTPGV